MLNEKIYPLVKESILSDRNMKAGNVSEVKECRRKAAEKREREEERAIIRKIKAEDKAAEDFKKYNIVIGG